MEIKLELIDIYPSISEIAAKDTLLIQFPQSEESNCSFNLADIINSKSEIGIHLKGKQSQLLLLKNNTPLANGQFNITNEAHWVSLISNTTTETKRKSANFAQSLLNCIKIKVKASLQSNPINDSMVSKNTNTSSLTHKKFFTKLNTNTGNLSKRNLKPHLKQQLACPEKSSHNRSYEEKCHRQFLGELYVDTNANNANNTSVIGGNGNQGGGNCPYTTKKSNNSTMQQREQREQQKEQMQKINSSAKSNKRFKNPLIKTRNESPVPLVRKDVNKAQAIQGMNRSTLTSEVKSGYHNNNNYNTNQFSNSKANNNNNKENPIIKLNSTISKKSNFNTLMHHYTNNSQHEVQTCVKKLEDNFNLINNNNSNPNDQIDNSTANANLQLEQLLNNSSQIEDNLLDDEELINQFEEIKNDFSLLYTEEYFRMIPNDLLKLEIELIVEKMFELINAYHSELNAHSKSLVKYKQLFLEYSEKFLLMNKKLMKFRQMKEEYQISKQSLNFIDGHYTKAKNEMLEINKEEFNLFKKLLNIQQQEKEQEQEQDKEGNGNGNYKGKVEDVIVMKRRKILEILESIKDKDNIRKEGESKSENDKVMNSQQAYLIEKIRERYERELKKEKERESERIEIERKKEEEKQREIQKEKDKEAKTLNLSPIKGLKDNLNTNASQSKNDKNCNPLSHREKGLKKEQHMGQYYTENSNNTNTNNNPLSNSNIKSHKIYGDTAGIKKKKRDK